MSAVAPELPPLWPLDESHLAHDYCWRCDSHGRLVQDPMVPDGDTIKVCADCAREREVYMIRTRSLGPDFVPVRRPEHGPR